MTNEHLLSNIRLGLSISESPDIKARGFSDVHFKDIPEWLEKSLR